MVDMSGLMGSSSCIKAVAALFGFFTLSDWNCGIFFAGSPLREFSSSPCFFIGFSGLPSTCWAVSLVCFFVEDAILVVSAKISLVRRLLRRLLLCWSHKFIDDFNGHIRTIGSQIDCTRKLKVVINFASSRYRQR
ncbi:hypothetical protein TMatcc_000793 [Talaromyces marneffei ATCC 18224]